MVFSIRVIKSNIRFKKGILLVICLLSLTVHAQKNQVKGKRITYQTDNPKTAGLPVHLDSAIRTYMQSPENCGLSIAVVFKGRTFFYNYGETARDNGILPDKSSIYELGATGNIFIGYLLAKAITENKISLDDPAHKFLPELQIKATKAREIKVRHLAAHTSGLATIPQNIREQPGFDSLNPFKNYSRKMLFEALSTMQLNTQPGKVYNYSVFGIALLGVILEKVYQQNFEALLMSAIIAPNNFMSTTVQMQDDQLARFCKGYDDNGNLSTAWGFGEVAAAGGVKSGSNDLIEFLKLQLGADKIALKSQEILHSARPQPALGWFVKRTKAGNDLYWQSGGTGGYSSFCGFIRNKGIAVVVLSNSARNVDYMALSVLNFLQR